MKKIIHKLLYTIILAFGFVVCTNIKVQAASASLSASTTEPTEGQSVTVTANVTAGAWNLQLSGAGKNETIYGYTQSNANASDTKSITFTAGEPGTKYEFSLTGDMTDITAESSEQVNKNITITVKAKETTTEPATNNTQTQTSVEETKKSSETGLTNLGINPKKYDFTGFKKDKLEYSVEVPNDVTSVEVYATPVTGAKVTGAGTVTLNEGNNTVGITVTSEDGSNKVTYKLTIKRKTVAEETAENGEARLKTLGIKPKEYDFSGFKSDQKEYSVEVPNEVEEIEIYATAIDSNAQITGTGIVEVEEGENELKIEVIAVNGTKETYILKVTRKESKNTETTEEKFGLETLSIAGLTLSPSFKVGTYEYTVELKEDIDSIEIQAESNEENAIVEIIGNENLQEGENIVTILVTNKDTNEVVTYQVIVNKNLSVEEIAQTSWLRPSTWGKEEKIKLAIIVVLIILIISAIILKIKMGKENDEPSDLEFPGADELDKAISEHQELTEEEIENVEEQNYIQDIAESRFGIEEELENKPRKKGRHF